LFASVGGKSEEKEEEHSEAFCIGMLGIKGFRGGVIGGGLGFTAVC